MYSAPIKKIKQGLFESTVHKVTKQGRSGRATPEPSLNPKHDIQPSSLPPCKPFQLQPSNTVSRDMSTSSPHSNKEASPEGSVSPLIIGQPDPQDRPGRCEDISTVPSGHRRDDLVPRRNTDPKHPREYDRMLSILGTLSNTLDYHMQRSNPLRMSDCIAKMTKSINEQTEIIKGRKDLSTERKLAKAKQDDEDIMNAYHRIEAAFQQLHTEAILSVWGIVDEQATNNLLDKLSPSKLAAHNSALSDDLGRRLCTENTRKQVLSDLDHWSNNPAAQTSTG
ncbi:hypothetical protein RHS01_04607 [Rhizoctonia solani]|uniref:Uncharacterized protein n=1 Tax=Rhizoctonia solani TaxID=456999 RepID=A0A8H7IFW8_9AGAM|nr:hypothetical protein RHS01_04607 [Rhizoctonia solani]